MAEISLEESEDGAFLHRDSVSFQAPLDAAIAACLDALSSATLPVKDAEARAHAALDDFKALEEFVEAVEEHMRHATFHDLPPVSSWGQIFPGLHQLICGAFRGVFLVERNGKHVAGLLFSREPHDLTDRLNELVVEHVQARGRGDKG